MKNQIRIINKEVVLGQIEKLPDQSFVRELDNLTGEREPIARIDPFGNLSLPQPRLGLPSSFSSASLPLAPYQLTHSLVGKKSDIALGLNLSGVLKSGIFEATYPKISDKLPESLRSMDINGKTRVPGQQQSETLRNSSLLPTNLPLEGLEQKRYGDRETRRQTKRILSSKAIGSDLSSIQSSSSSNIPLGNNIPLTPSEPPPPPPTAPVAAVTTLSGNYQIDGILANYKWGFSWGSRQLTYSFYDSTIFNGTYYGSETGVQGVSDGIKSNVRTIMNWLSNVINVDFVEVTETANDYGRIRILESTGPSYAYAYYPFSDELASVTGDVHLNPTYDYAGEINGFQNAAGKHGYTTLLHEIGHVLGLKHSFDAPALPINESSQTNTVMTYTFDANEPGTYMGYDLRALQYLYGAKAYNSSNTLYQFTSQIDQFSVNGQLALNTPFSTKQLIWDSDGGDTLDFSQLATDTGGYRFDLNPGGLLSLQTAYTTTDNNNSITYGTAIAYNVLLENVVNSSSDDTIYLNNAANTLQGYNPQRFTGGDILWNATNQDTLDLSTYSSTAVTRTLTGNDLILGLGGNGSIALKNYYAGNAPVVVFSDGVENGFFLNINNVNLLEGNSGTNNAIFTVTLSQTSSQTVTVNYTTADSIATAGNDYIATTGMLTFAPGETSKTVNVAVIGDTLNETNETFFLNLSGATNATLLNSQGIGTIQNDDISLSINDVSLSEGNSGTKNATFTVSLSQASSQTVSVNYGAANGTATAGSDYTATSGTLTFAPGVTSQTINVPVLGDTLNEPNETFWVNLSGATNASIADSQGIGTIVNDDPVLLINDVSLTEGNSGTKNATFTVTLSQASTQTVSVNYATANGTATTGTKDYTAKTGTLTFAAGVTSQTISVAVTGDTVGEYDEQFYVNLTTPTNATIADNQGIGTISNDDPALIINDIQVQEGPSNTTANAIFTVTLTVPSTNTVSVAYATANGTAVSGTDYTAAQGTLSFSPGQTTKTITVPIRGDNLVETNETFFVNLSSNKNATLLDKQGIGTILNYSATGSVPVGNNSINGINGTDGPDTLQGTENDNQLAGLGGSDVLSAGGGADLLIGADPNSAAPGQGEIDTLTGGLGADLFVLGDANQVYYDDGNQADSGYGDYGLIVDFNASQGDLIQLHGFAADYSFGSSPDGLPSGTAISLNGELVGLIQNVAPTSIPSNGISYVTFPLANADAAITRQNTAANISVLANDRDVWAIDSFSQGSQGSVILNNNGTPNNSRDDFLTYTPNTGFSGSDSFSYTISDGNGGTDTATVSVVVQSPFSEVFDAATGKFKLGEALNFTALALGNQPSGNSFSMTNSWTTVNGTIALGAGAKQSFSGPPQVTGDYFYDPLAQSVNLAQVNLGGSGIQTDLTQAETDVGNLAAQAIALTPTQSFGTIKAAQTITAASIGANTPSQNVIRINGIDLSKGATLTLQGDADDVFVIQVFDPTSTQASLKMAGNSQLILNGGLTPGNVLWYVEGQLTQSGTAIARGTFLALDPDNKFNQDVNINGSSLEGQIFANSITLTGGAQVTGVPAKTLYGTANADALNGTSSNDSIFGRAGDDTITGLAGNDWLEGGSGNDQLQGNDGNDVLLGGLGNDDLLGGAGSDIFVLVSGQGTDTISDFVPGTDVMGLSNGLTFDLLNFSGNNILFGSQVLAILPEVDATTLTASNFR
jgi:serralysin